MSDKTPSSLARAVGNWLPSVHQVPNSNRPSVELAHKSLAELQELATKAPLEERVARLEGKADVRAWVGYDPGRVNAAFTRLPYGPAVPGVEQFQRELKPLAVKHGVHVDVAKIAVATHVGKVPGFRFVPLEEFAKDGGFDLVPRLAPAESCAEAVSRFRDALELLAKRHGVDVEVGGIAVGSGGGMEWLPDPREVDAEYRAKYETAERERMAWDQIEAWADKESSCGRFREAAFKKMRTPHFGRGRFVLDLIKRESDAEYMFVSERRSFRGETRLAALEAAAAWCKEQK